MGRGVAHELIRLCEVVRRILGVARIGRLGHGHLTPLHIPAHEPDLERHRVLPELCGIGTRIVVVEEAGLQLAVRAGKRGHNEDHCKSGNRK